MVDVLCTPLHVHFIWGVALVGILSTGHCSPCVGNYFSCRERKLVQELSGEIGLIVAYSVIFKYSG